MVLKMDGASQRCPKAFLGLQKLTPGVKGVMGTKGGGGEDKELGV